MAGRSIGTIFAEIDLDPSRYTRGQKRLLNDAKATTLNIEANFKKLGIKSSAEFDLLRQRAENAFNRIKNSNQVTANDIVRAEKKKNETLKKLQEQQYGTQSSFANAIKKNWLAVTASVAAAFYAVKRVVDTISPIILDAARYETLGVSMRTVGRNAGYTAEQMDEFQKGLEKTGITMSGARQALTRMGQAQLDLAYSSKLARIAQDAAVIGAMNSTEAFNNLVYGIQTANVRVLRTIGINVSWQESYKKMAEQLGRTTTSFTEQEKATIRLNAVIEAGQRITGTYEAAMTTAGKQLYSLQRYVDNLKVKIGEGLVPILGELVTETTEFIKSLNPEDIKFISDSIKILAESFLALGKAIVSIPSFVMKVAGAMETEVTVLTDVDEIVKSNTKSWLEHSRALKEAEANYLSLSAAAGERKAPGPIGGDITQSDKEKSIALQRTWMDDVRELRRLERELEQEHLIEVAKTYDDFWRYKIKGTKEAADRAIALEQRQAKLEKQIRQKGRDDLQYIFNTMMNLAQGHSREVFELSKVAATANAIVNTYAGAAQALNSGIPYPYNLIAAAAVIAFGLAQVAQIQSQSFDSGGGVAGAAVTTYDTGTYQTPTYSEPETQEQRGTVNIYVQGDILGNKESMEYLAELLSEHVEKYDVRLVASHARMAESLL